MVPYHDRERVQIFFFFFFFLMAQADSDQLLYDTLFRKRRNRQTTNSTLSRHRPAVWPTHEASCRSGKDTCLHVSRTAWNCVQPRRSWCSGRCSPQTSPPAPRQETGRRGPISRWTRHPGERFPFCRCSHTVRDKVGTACTDGWSGGPQETLGCWSHTAGIPKLKSDRHFPRSTTATRNLEMFLELSKEHGEKYLSM